jgi:hypothetical protein
MRDVTAQPRRSVSVLPIDDEPAFFAARHSKGHA